jgi:hypothetical protein
MPNFVTLNQPLLGDLGMVERKKERKKKERLEATEGQWLAPWKFQANLLPH